MEFGPAPPNSRITNLTASCATVTYLTETTQPDQRSPARPRARRPRATPRRSSIVGHPDQARIERDLALGRPLQRIARKYGVSKDAAWRHKKHLPPQLKTALAGHALAPGQDLDKIRVDESEGLLANLAAQRARLLISQDAAMEAEQFGVVAQLASGIHRNLELVGRYLGEFAQHSIHTTISLLVTPEYLGQLSSAPWRHTQRLSAPWRRCCTALRPARLRGPLSLS
jgi:hypothetical protein